MTIQRDFCGIRMYLVGSPSVASLTIHLDYMEVKKQKTNLSLYYFCFLYDVIIVKKITEHVTNTGLLVRHGFTI